MEENLEKQESEVSTQIQPGCLYVVSTPIGNLGDISNRAIEILRGVSTILAEDTRSFRVIASRFGILTPVESYHDHNEQSRTEALIPRLKSGESFALVSEAGTPGISDPGYRILSACREADVPMRPVPGASALLAALSVCGFEIESFAFYGFLPQRPGKRRRALEEILQTPLTAVIYESPYKILALVETIAELAPERRLFVARELTKRFEEHFYGTAVELVARLSKSTIRGEYVVVIQRVQ